jgi:hypothetical protein
VTTPESSEDGRRAIFERPAGHIGKHTGRGRSAFFSVRPDQEGRVAVECSSCRLATRMSLTEAGMRVMSFTLWFPWREHNRWITCPACNRRTWCRVRWLG